MINKFCLTPFLLLLGSCGFALKGLPSTSHHLPTTQWHISGGELQQPLQREMYRALAQDSKKNQDIQGELRVLSVHSQKDIYTITRAAKLNEYLLSMRATAQAYHDGQPWGDVMVVEARRTMHYTDSMVLGKAEEEQTIWQEIRQDLANQIITRLAFLPEVAPPDDASTTVLP